MKMCILITNTKQNTDSIQRDKCYYRTLALYGVASIRVRLTADDCTGTDVPLHRP